MNKEKRGTSVKFSIGSAQLNVHDGDPDEMKRSLWREKRIFFPFSVPWKRFIGVLLADTFDYAVFTGLACVLAYWLAPLFGYGKIPFLNLWGIIWPLALALHTLFYLSNDKQAQLHTDYMIHALRVLVKEDMMALKDAIKQIKDGSQAEIKNTEKESKKEKEV